ncbi:MAG: ATP-binding region ATPase domain protein [Proteobacteria bacterium]|nr:ATP-binding region ATPase domain protein [Pseudomonadota bacterium]
MASSVLNSLPLLLITAGLALLAAGIRIGHLARSHRKRMEKLLQLANQDIAPLELPGAAWPELATAGWQNMRWEGYWFGQPVSGSMGNPTTAATFEFAVGSDETRLRLYFSHSAQRGEERLFADQLARVFVLLLETRLRARTEALSAALAERARLSLYLQHDMRNLAQWVCWVSADFASATDNSALQDAACRLRDNAPLAHKRAERLIATLGQTPTADQPETIDVRQAITQAAQMAGFVAEIDGEAQAWMDKSLLARALDNLFANLAAVWRDPQAARPVFQLRPSPARGRGDDMAEIAFFCPWPAEIPSLEPEKLFEPFASGRPGGLGLGLYQARKSLIEGGGTLTATPSPEGLRFLLSLPAPAP